MDELRGRVAVVTGAASGIGLALCERFAAEGMRVVMSDVAAVPSIDGDVLAVTADVRSWESMDELAERAFEHFGAVHVLCNNAGVQLDRRVWEFTRDEWEWVLGVNWGGVVHGLHAFLPRMIASGEPGHVVNTASVGGLLAFPRIAPYTAAKFAVVGLSEALANDLREEGVPIGVSVLCPGPTMSALRENSDRLRPQGEGAGPSSVAHVHRVPAADVAAAVVEAIRGDRFWILTHPEYNDLIEQRAAGILEGGAVVAADVR
jgi:NAD(P)-dependent dehydrogenase (short-subunit alcohol dehydrogenase family)